MNSISTGLLAEGKTKKILMANTPGRVIVESKNDLTAGDGAKHLDPKNTVLAALQILAMRNPRLYAELRFRQEEHLCNIVRI